MCTIYRIIGGKWNGEEAIVDRKTKKGYFVILLNVQRSNLERLSFSNKDTVYAIKSKHPSVYVQTLQDTNQVYVSKNKLIKDTSGTRLLQKWYGKSRRYVLQHIRL